jgi:hypothetical protein
VVVDGLGDGLALLDGLDLEEKKDKKRQERRTNGQVRAAPSPDVMNVQRNAHLPRENT